MLCLGLVPEYLTYPFVLKAASRLSEVRVGFSVHGRVVKDGLECDRFVRNGLIHFGGWFREVKYVRKVFDEMFDKNLVSWNSMLDCYVKCREVELAGEVFGVMPEKDVVSWSCMVDGCVKCGEYGEALEVFREMCGKGAEANEVTMVSVLGACAHLGALERGVLMHRYIVDNRIGFTLVLRTSLVDMYAKCGAIDDALVVKSVLDHLAPIHTGIEIPNPTCLFVAFIAIKQFVKGCRLKSAASVATDAVCFYIIKVLPMLESVDRRVRETTVNSVLSNFD